MIGHVILVKECAIVNNVHFTMNNLHKSNKIIGNKQQKTLIKQIKLIQITQVITSLSSDNNLTLHFNTVNNCLITPITKKNNVELENQKNKNL